MSVHAGGTNGGRHDSVCVLRNFKTIFHKNIGNFPIFKSSN